MQIDTELKEIISSIKPFFKQIKQTDFRLFAHIEKQY